MLTDREFPQETCLWESLTGLRNMNMSLTSFDRLFTAAILNLTVLPAKTLVVCGVEFCSNTAVVPSNTFTCCARDEAANASINKSELNIIVLRIVLLLSNYLSYVNALWSHETYQATPKILVFLRLVLNLSRRKSLFPETHRVRATVT